ncbi:MAG: trigger factor [Candidatus Omnitrophota bacterium]
MVKTEVKKLDSTKREINVEVSGEIVKNKFEDVFKKIAKDAKVPGFRPGNAPRDILEKHYSANAHEHVLRELVPEVYGQAIDKEKLDVVELPEISDVKLDRSNLSFKAVVEVTPQIEIKHYKGIELNYKKLSASPDEIKRYIDSLKEARKVDAADDNFAKSLGYPNLIELERATERQISIQKENTQRQRMETEIIDSLINGLDFKLPQSLINRQLQELVRQAKLDLALKGVGREKIDEHEAKLSKELEPEAKRQVKVYLVLAEIAKKEKIALDNKMTNKVMEMLFREADWKELS